MMWYEVLIILSAIIFVLIIIVSNIYKMIKYEPGNSCAFCDKRCNHFIKYYNKQKKKKCSYK